MKAGWETRTLAEVCQIKPPKSEARRILAGTDLVSFVPMEYLGIDDKILIPRQEKPLADVAGSYTCLLYTSPSPRDGLLSRMPSSA